MTKWHPAQEWISWFGLATPATASDLGARRALLRSVGIAVGSAFFVVMLAALGLSALSRWAEWGVAPAVVEAAAFTPGSFIGPQINAGYLRR